MCHDKPIADYDPNVSAYLQRPLRSYEEALRDVLRAKRYRERIWKTLGPVQCADATSDAGPDDDKE